MTTYLFRLTRRLAAARTQATLIALLAGLSACTTDGGGVTAPAAQSPQAPPSDLRVASVLVTPASVTGNLGETGQFTAVARNAGGMELPAQQYTWVSADPTIVRVSASGYVAAVGVGSTTVIATVGGVSGQSQVSIAGEPLMELLVSPSEFVGKPGEVTQFRATLMGESGVIRGRPVVWVSDDSSVVTVDSTGSATQVRLGTATISAISAGRHGGAHVVVQAPAAPVPTAPPAPTPTPPPAAVATVTLSPGSFSPTVGQLVPFSAVLKDANGNVLTGRSVSWSSSNTGVVSVSASGLATAVSVGSAAVVAASEGRSGQAAVIVTAPPPTPPTASAVSNVSVSPASKSLFIGSTQQLSATVLDANGNPLAGQTVAWASSNAAAATVSANGLVTAIAAGSATISATSSGKSGSATITVTPPAPPPPPVSPTVGSVSLSPSSASILVGGTQLLVATVMDGNGNAMSGQLVAWSSSHTGFATVNASGVVTAVGAGSAIISAASGGKTGTASIAVTISAPPPSTVATVTVSPASVALNAGATQQLSATMRDAQSNVLSGQSVAWSTSNAAAATVNGAGLVTAVAAGSATITATSSGKTGTASVSISVAPSGPPATVSVTPSAASVVVGGTQTLSATVRDAQGTVLSGQSIAWSSSNGHVSVNAGGVVKGMFTGSSTISAVTGGKTGSANINIIATAPGPVATVTVSPSGSSLQVGSSQTLSATMRDASGNVLSGQTVSWSSSNALIASVSSGGVVTALVLGSTTITAASGGKSGTAMVSVMALAPPPPPPPGGDPAPNGNDLMLVDTRAGGAQSWQGITDFSSAMNRLKANGSAVTSFYAVDDARSGWVSNFDGAGTSVFRSSMYGVDMVANPGGQDGGGGSLGLFFTKNTHQHVIIQYKLWMGRTAAGGGLGQNGVFTIHNDANAANNAGRKLILIMRDKPGDVGGSSGRIDVDWRGQNPVPMITSGDTEGFYNQPDAPGGKSFGLNKADFQPQPLINSWITVTFEIQNSSSEMAPDGYIRTWYNGVLRQEVLNIVTANYPLSAVTLGATFRSPKQDQTEYVKDIVVWTPR